MQTEQKNHQIKKVQHILIEDLLNCATMFLSFIKVKLKAIRVTQTETPKMVKMSASTNKLSHFLWNTPQLNQVVRMKLIRSRHSTGTT